VQSQFERHLIEIMIGCAKRALCSSPLHDGAPPVSLRIDS